MALGWPGLIRLGSWQSLLPKKTISLNKNCSGPYDHGKNDVVPATLPTTVAAAELIGTTFKDVGRALIHLGPDT